MKFFVEQEFPPPDLPPKSRKLAFKCEKITTKFIKQVRKLDHKMWVQVCKIMVDRNNFDCPQTDELDRALDGVMQQLESSSKLYHFKIEALGELLNIKFPLYPFNHLKDEVRAELTSIVKVSFGYFKALEDLQFFLLDKG